jgi:hypothetical protein
MVSRLPGRERSGVRLCVMRATTSSQKPVVLLSYGLGTHSTAAAVEIIENPEARDFELDQLIVLTAMTGDE